MGVFEDLQRQMVENRKVLAQLREEIEAGNRTLSYDETKELMQQAGMNHEEVMKLYRLSKAMQEEEQPEVEPEKPEIPKVTREEVNELYERAIKTRRPSDILKYMKAKRLHRQWMESQEEINEE
ncbi:hypothetical protein [Planifilum fimeticola]